MEKDIGINGYFCSYEIYTAIHIRSDFQGYNDLIDLYAVYKDFFLNGIKADFSKTSWFEADFSYVPGGIINKIQSIIKDVKLNL
ncbi:MAG: hypothetical protein JXA03_07320 [Bacteroidales bacterium]|nr:hypothetical protein [Bacteroidales bacterium]